MSLGSFAITARSTDIVTTVNLLDYGRSTTPLRLDIFGAPFINEMIMMLTPQFFINIVAHFVDGCGRWKNGQGQLRRTRGVEEAVTQKSSREPSSKAEVPEY